MFGGLSVAPPQSSVTGPTGSFPDPNYFNNPQSVKQDLDITRDLVVEGSTTAQGEVIAESDVLVQGDIIANQDVTVAGKTTTNSFENETLATFQQGARFNESGSTGTNKDVVLSAPGIYYGNGSGLTNLPVANLDTPNFSFQSGVLDFGLVDGRFLDPEVVAISVTIPCDLSGQPPGLYYWVTRADILLQGLWNSASGTVLWDGTRVNGELGWSMYQAFNLEDPDYTLCQSYLFLLETTGFNVSTESTNSSVDPLQVDSYYVDFYRLATFGVPPPPPPPP